jgi:hypothetical protein
LPEKRRWLDGLGETDAKHSENADVTANSAGSPLHPEASAQQLKVMTDMLTSRGVTRFRPDMCGTPTDPFNTSCWNFATDVFLALVECKEYTGLLPKESTREAVLNAITGYTKDQLFHL